MSFNLAIQWMDSHSTIGSPLKLELLGVAYGMGLALVCYACCFFAMVAMNSKDHEFGLKFSFRYQRFELWYDNPNCLRIIRISSGVSKRNKRGGSIMMQIYVNFEGFALISALFGLILYSDLWSCHAWISLESELDSFKIQSASQEANT